MEEKEKAIREERKLMLKLLDINPIKKRDTDLGEALIRRTVSDIAFMRIELDGLKEKLALEGWQDDYQNGANQGGTKQNPAAKTYIDVQKLYNQTVRHLETLAQGAGADTDELMEFLGK